MGRTLHYTIKLEKNYTDREITKVYEINEKYQLKYNNKSVWTCETFWCDPYDFYPKWNAGSTWEQVENEFQRGQKAGKNRIEIIKDLKARGLILFHHENKKEISGFVKVQGNEFNALMVLHALVEISRVFKGGEIHLHDEGKFLYGDVIIKNGKCMFDVEKTIDSIKHWASIKWFSANARDMDIFDQKEQEELFKTNYNTYAGGYLTDEMGELKIIIDKLKKIWPKDIQFCLWNIQGLESQQWFNHDDVHRPVNIKDYIEYEGGAGKIMDGFGGEGFGLSDPKIAEQQGAELTNQWFSLWGDKVKVMGEI